MNSKLNIFCVLLVLLMVCLPTGVGVEDGKKSIALIVAAGNSDWDSVSKANLKRIYLGKTKKLDAKKVVPINLKSGTMRETFDAKVLGMTAKQLKDYWIKESLRGGAKPPKAFKSVKAVSTYVSKVAGAIGYIDYSLVDEAMLKKVKVIGFSVDGKIILPSDDGYELTTSN